MDFEKSIESVKEILEKIKEESSNKKPIIVEGDRDVEALRSLGFKSTIITANQGISLIEFCDRLANKYEKIIILTDWDKKGGYLCYTIKRNLEGRVQCNTDFRKKLAQNAAIKKIEGLPSWIETMEQRCRLQ
ncbi:MAG: toprim domain-containing protein [Candidatus Thermoplasmatota archaeon]